MKHRYLASIWANVLECGQSFVAPARSLAHLTTALLLLKKCVGADLHV